MHTFLSAFSFTHTFFFNYSSAAVRCAIRLCDWKPSRTHTHGTPVLPLARIVSSCSYIEFGSVFLSKQLVLSRPAIFTLSTGSKVFSEKKRNLILIEHFSLIARTYSWTLIGHIKRQNRCRDLLSCHSVPWLKGVCWDDHIPGSNFFLKVTFKTVFNVTIYEND